MYVKKSQENISILSGISPIIGFIFAIIASIQWWRKKDSRFIIVIAFIWNLLHIYEVIIYGDFS